MHRSGCLAGPIALITGLLLTDPATAEQAHPAYPSSRSPSTNRHPDRPNYVGTLLDYSEDAEEMSWLEFGLEQRTRFEIRDDFFRAGQRTDERFLLRSRAFLGIREIFDPLRFGFEFQDSRQFGSELPENRRTVDEHDLLQAFAELYFPDALGTAHPFSFRVGRMSFDAVDRRLFARNRFRNTTNAFDGFRVRLGDQSTVWEVDVFAFMPVERRLRHFDPPDDERWLYGVTGYWRGWSPHLTLEPYYFVLDEDFRTPGTDDRTIHTLGVHGFGLIGDSGFDYDFNVAYQFGDRETGRHRAFAARGEVGYTFKHDWKPRAAVMLNYASGDDDPSDDLSERFDSLFGAAHNFYGHADLFGWQNMINPALYLSVRPTSKLRIETFYRTYWLASKTDAFVRAGLRDPLGESGAFIGQELDVRVRYKLSRHIEFDIGYAWFLPGVFVENVTPTTDDSDFFYVATRITF
jgi:hypothetical protein